MTVVSCALCSIGVTSLRLGVLLPFRPLPFGILAIANFVKFGVDFAVL